jgi:site-specific DNA-methyltransferase (adenine-specific)
MEASGMIRILIGDCRERLKDLSDNSVDSVVCDPPYHLTSIVKRFGAENAAPAKVGKTGAYARASKGFMGQTWDGGDVAFQPDTWAEVLRVLRPGGHLIAFSGTRTYHRMAVAIEDAGFEIRDQLAWVYGSGFPKSHNQPGGWGTALKPSWEPIALCRKPLVGPVAANMTQFGTGALNIDGCRIETSDDDKAAINAKHAGMDCDEYERPAGVSLNLSVKPMAMKAAEAHPQGRWPANLCHDGSDEVVAGFPITHSEGGGDKTRAASLGTVSFGNAGGQDKVVYHGEGSAARFFYCAKATTEERGEGNNHPTVKPVALMSWLVRLVTPKGGTVLDPFMGSGSTALACDAEQFDFIGCELSADYAAIAERRTKAAAGMFANVSVESAGPATRSEAA